MQETTNAALRLLNSEEASAVLRVSKSTLYRLVKTGKLHRSGVATGRSLFPMNEIVRLATTLVKL